MDPDGLQRLARTIQILFDHVPEPFILELIWVSDRPLRERNVSRRQMLDIVDQGAIETRTTYRIQPA